MPTGPGLGVTLDEDKMCHYGAFYEKKGDYYARFHQDPYRPDWHRRRPLNGGRAISPRLPRTAAAAKHQEPSKFDIPTIHRPEKALVEGLASIGTATASSELYKMGIRHPVIAGAVPHSRGKVVAGPAVTLQFMPKREDLYGDDEYADRERQLHRHALYQIEAGDVVVVYARGNMESRIFGEMMLPTSLERDVARFTVPGQITHSS